MAHFRWLVTGETEVDGWQVHSAPTAEPPLRKETND
jgi:hypothetical protein